MMSEFQVTQVEERHKTLQSDVKEYVLGLAEVRKMLNEENLDEVTFDNLMEDKAQITDTIDEQGMREKKKQKTKNDLCREGERNQEEVWKYG